MMTQKIQPAPLTRSAQIIAKMRYIFVLGMTGPESGADRLTRAIRVDGLGLWVSGGHNCIRKIDIDCPP